MPSKNQIKKQKTGFTIIEVVLVLAIAGLIFLMVFVALPALQRSQRDTQRRQDFANLEAAVENYMTNNNGKLPSSTTPASVFNLGNDGKDPEGKPYSLSIKTTVPDKGTAPTTQQVWIVTGADCTETSTASSNKGSSAPKANTSTRAFAIYGYLESGTYCQSNF